jgi:tRNA C32,U32 (ribose-2'-O)-methylase TrmJ
LRFVQTVIKVKNQYFCTLINEFDLKQMKKPSDVTTFLNNFYQKYNLNAEEIQVLMTLFKNWLIQNAHSTNS